MWPGELAIVGFAGHVRSGKTTLMNAVAAGLADVTSVSFGRAVRERAQRLGRPDTDRRVLVQIGSEWVEDDPAGLCAAVLAQADRTAKWCLIDGIRHRTIWTHLTRQVAPAPACLVYLEAPERLLVDRLTAAGIAGDTAIALLRDSTEIDVPRLRSSANVIIDAHASPQVGATAVLEALAGAWSKTTD